MLELIFIILYCIKYLIKFYNKYYDNIKIQKYKLNKIK